MEKSLAAGNSYSIAAQEVEKWAMKSDNIYNDWFTRWGDPEDENKDWLPNSQTFGKYLDQIKDQEIDKVNISNTRKDLEVSMKVYENIKYNDKLQKWEGDIFNDAKKVSDAFYNRALNDFNLSDQEIGLMINSLGATPLEELYIVSRRVVENFNKKKIKVFKNYVGRYATSMEMAGMSVTVLKLNENIKENLLAPSYCPFWTN